MKSYFLIYRVATDEPIDLDALLPVGGLVIEAKTTAYKDGLTVAIADYSLARSIAHQRYELNSDERLLVVETIEKSRVLHAFVLHRQYEKDTAEFLELMA